MADVAIKSPRRGVTKNTSLTPSSRMLVTSTNRVKESLDRDLLRIEVAAVVDAAIAIGTASVLGSGHTVTQSQCLALAHQMRKQTKFGMVR
jgi:hypothetical protein